ncbi:MAG: glycosyltransferase family 4 protein, partial [Deltaproteobacteria bacterium]|nr:glycosyltransferase family 4 protein [Deltaproteobacteria bacterium]
ARRWDAALSHWALPCAVATGLGFDAHRHVAVWHSADVQLATRLLGRRAWQATRALAREHVFVAEHLRARVGAARDVRAHVVPMGVDLPARPPQRRSIDGRRLRALVLARLVPIKRVELAIAACADAGVELVIAGDGPERLGLERLARARGGRVRFEGTVSPARRDALFAESDVLLACSAHDPRGVTEGYPVAPREALAHGVVVIATRDPVHEELARRCGRAVILRAPDALASSLRALSSDPTEISRLSRLAPEHVEADGWRSVGLRIERLLEGPRSNIAERSDLDASRAGVR